MLVVIINSVFMATHNYDFRLEENPHEAPLSEDIASKTFLAIFLIEFVCKVVAWGFVRKPSTYLRNGYNIIDFVCLMTAVLE